MRQAIAQPVVISPRGLSETFAALARSGVPRGGGRGAGEKTGPTIDAPGDSPAGGDIASGVERNLRGIGKVGSAAGRDLRAGEQPVQMRNVPVLLFRRFGIPVLQPFLQLPVSPDLIRRQSRTDRLQLLSK